MQEMETSENIRELDKKILQNPDSADLYIQRGNFKKAAEDYEGAVQDYNRAGRLYTEIPEQLLSLICEVRLLQNDTNSAIALMNRAIGKKTYNPDLYILRAKAFEFSGDFRAALLDSTKAVELNPENYTAVLQHGSALEKLKKYSEAVEEFEKAALLNPNAPEVYLRLGTGKKLQIEKSSGTHSQKFAQMEKECLSLLNKAVELGNGRADCLIGRASMYLAFHRPDEAIKDFQKAAVQRISSEDFFFIHRNLAELHFNKKEYKKAYENYEKIIKKNSQGTAYPENWMRTVREKAEQIRKMMNDSGRGAEPEIPAVLDPFADILEEDSSPKAYVQIIEDYMDAGKYEEVIQYVDSLIEEENSGRLFYLRGKADRKLERFEDALKDMEKAFLAEPENSLYSAFRAEIYFHMKRFEESVLDFDRAIRNEPDNADYYYLRAGVKMHLKKYEDAFLDYDRAVDLAPGSAFYSARRGNAFFRMEKYRDALLDYDRAVEFEPENADWYSERGEVKAALGNTESAEDDFQKAHELDSKKYPEGRKNAEPPGIRALKEAEKFLNQGRKGEALQKINEAIESGVSVPAVFHKKGYIEFQLGKYEDSVLSYSEAVRLNPLDAACLNSRARAFFELVDLENAEKDYDKVILLDRNYADAYLGRAVINSLSAKYDSALKDLNVYFGFRPDDPVLFRERASVYRALGQSEKAAEDLMKALDLDSNNIDIMYELSVLLFSLKRYEDTEKLCGRILALDSKRTDVSGLRGLARSKSGNILGALDDFLKEEKL